jgi:hypothetical protein
VLFSLVRPLGRFVPPVVAALAAGAIAIGVLGGFAPREGASGIIADPVFFVPKFSEAALLDLVLPLAISVVVLQNAQGIGILRMARHDPPANMITTVCGGGTIVFGLFGAVCTCLTGPVNAILSSSGEPRNHYLGAFIWAGFAFLFGLFAPGIIGLALAVPDAFIYVIGGLAMLRVLQQSLAAAFGGKFTAGAVVSMTVTVTELIPEARFTLLGIGAPFWGLVFGILASLLLEPGDFRKPAAQPVPAAEPAAAPAPRVAPVPARAALEPETGKASAPPEAGAEPPERPRPPVPAWALDPDRKPEPERAAAAEQPTAPPLAEALTKQLAPFTPPAGEAAEDAGAKSGEAAPEPAAPAPEAVTKQLAPFTAPEGAKTGGSGDTAETPHRARAEVEEAEAATPPAEAEKRKKPKRERKPPA